MSDAIESYSNIYNNPFIFAPLIQQFYTPLPQSPKNILLAYLVLPSVLYISSRNFLLHSNKNSSLQTMREQRSRFYGLTSRVEEYKSMTNTCLQHALNLGAVSLGEDLSVQSLGIELDTSACPEGTVRAALKLGNLLAPYDILSTYRLLGVKRL